MDVTDDLFTVGQRHALVLGKAFPVQEDTSRLFGTHAGIGFDRPGLTDADAAADHKGMPHRKIVGHEVNEFGVGYGS